MRRNAEWNVFSWINLVANDQIDISDFTKPLMGEAVKWEEPNWKIDKRTPIDVSKLLVIFAGSILVRDFSRNTDSQNYIWMLFEMSKIK